eukprot:COSAG06_NODE_18695_length_873_cov_0.782946_1_plen_154_part_10
MICHCVLGRSPIHGHSWSRFALYVTHEPETIEQQQLQQGQGTSLILSDEPVTRDHRQLRCNEGLLLAIMAAAAEEEALTLGLTPDEREHYEREGWVIKRNVFPRDECAALVERMTAVHDAGAPGYPGPPRAADDWNGFGNPHLYDEEIARWMLD